MKVVVTHPDRQHCNHLLLALSQAGWLERFFTLFSSNKVARWESWFPHAVRQQLRKRAVDNSLTPYIRHFPLLFVADRWLSRALADRVCYGYEWFDRKVAKKLKHCDFELVITYENANRHTLRAAKALGKTTLLDLAQIHHNDILEYGREFMTAEQWRLEASLINPRKIEALEHTDYVLALSRFAAHSMLRHGWPAERLFTVPLGVDATRFKAKDTYRRDGPLRLLFTGTITRRKGLAILLEAMHRLPPHTAELTLIGPLADGTDLLNTYAGIFQYRPFMHHEELAEQYRQADLFVFPSLLDSWAQTVLEAMACGTPALVSDRTGAAEVVEQGGGWVIPAGRVDALVAALERCAAKRDELAAAGQRAALLARQYSWGRYQEQLLQVLGQIMP